MTTLAGTGASEFWILDPVSKSVTVISKSNGRVVYAGNAAVPVTLAPPEFEALAIDFVSCQIGFGQVDTDGHPSKIITFWKPLTVGSRALRLPISSIFFKP